MWNWRVGCNNQLQHSSSDVVPDSESSEEDGVKQVVASNVATMSELVEINKIKIERVVAGRRFGSEIWENQKEPSVKSILMLNET